MISKLNIVVLVGVLLFLEADVTPLEVTPKITVLIDSGVTSLMLCKLYRKFSRESLLPTRGIINLKLKFVIIFIQLRLNFTHQTSTLSHQILYLILSLWFITSSQPLIGHLTLSAS